MLSELAVMGSSSSNSFTSTEAESISSGPTHLAITLLEMNGTQYDLEVSFGATVADLKHVAKPILQVPVEFQVFAIGTELPKDDEPLCAYLQAPQSGKDPAPLLFRGDLPLLVVTFCFSDGGILSHESTAARVAAIDALTHVAHAGRKQVIDVFLGLSEDENELCRQAAVSALAGVAALAAVGNERFLSALAARLLDDHKLVAVTAVQALANAVESGNEAAGLTLLEFVEYIEDQEDVMLQLAVIEACLKLPKAHDRRLMRSLLNTFKTSTTNRVQCAAKNTAAELVRRSRLRSMSCSF